MALAIFLMHGQVKQQNRTNREEAEDSGHTAYDGMSSADSPNALSRTTNSQEVESMADKNVLILLLSPSF